MREFCVPAPDFRLFLRNFVAISLIFLISALCLAPDAEAARRKKRPVKAYSPPYASMVYDVNAGRVLQETHGSALRHPASVTKVMTLYMLFEQMERGRFTLNSELRVSAFAHRQSPSKLGVRAGDTISVEDAIKALVTKSANDVAVVVAEAIGGSEERFGEMMTAKARSIGMTHSVFRNASGLPNPAQVTTARDLVTLGRVIQDRFPRQYAYFGTRNFEYDGSVYRNHNRLLGKIEGVDGIKTGYTRASGFNLLTSAKVDGRHIITVVLGGRSARARDMQVASLVETHMDRAVAGRRTPRATEIARVETPDEPRLDPRPALRPVPPAPAAAALPPARPRPAVVAETSERLPELTKSRPLALSASGSTNVVQSATTPLALVSTTPRNPAFRQQDTALPRTLTAEGRIVPPASVRYTNSANGPAARGDVAQPLPVPSPPVAAQPDAAKTEQRVASAPAKAAILPAPRPEPAAAQLQPSAKTTAAAAAPARSGWVIQLAAAESESKARVVLDTARGKNASLLKAAEAFTEAVSKGGSTLYRARFAGFDASEAQEACKSLKRTGFNCFAQKL